MIKSRKVQLPALAEVIKLEGDEIQIISIIHRLEDFFREVEFDYEMIALLLLFCLGDKSKIRLCIDRTEWDFGKTQVNILMVIACNGVNCVPLYWELLANKSCNSHTSDRIGLLENIVTLVGVSRIGILIADREFIGHSWLKYLKNRGIDFCIRVPKHHQIENLEGQKYWVEDLGKAELRYLKNCLVDKVWVNIYLKKLENGDFLFLIGTMDEPKHLGQVYRKRWTIETVFQSFKSRGFDLESSHLKHLDRLKKMIGMVSIAFAFCINLSIYKHGKVQKIKKHGYKENSFCRVGIDWLKDLMKKPVKVFEEYIEKFLRYLRIQKIKFDKKRLNKSLSIS